jgi:hypothetical protein
MPDAAEAGGGRDADVGANADADADAPDDASAEGAACPSGTNFDTDPNHCGRCDHSCLGGVCRTGVCEPFRVARGDSTWFLALDPNNVYFTDLGPGGIFYCPRGGCPGSSILLTMPFDTSAAALAVEHGVVLYSTPAGTIVACPPAKCMTAPTVLVAATPDSRTLHTDGTAAYWVETGEIRSCPLAGCASATTLATIPLASPGATDALIVEQRYAVTTTRGTYACTLPACADLAILGGPVQSEAIASDGTNLYWFEYPASQLVRCDAVLGCHGAPTVLQSGQEYTEDAVSDGQVLFWPAKTSGRLLACALPGCAGAPRAMALGQNQPTSVALDETAFYWTLTGTTSNTGGVMRLAR